MSDDTHQKRWTVIRHRAQGSAHMKWFDTRAEADAEAVGLASRNIGKRYDVLEVVGTCSVPCPTGTVDEVTAARLG